MDIDERRADRLPYAMGDSLSAWGAEYLDARGVRPAPMIGD